MNRARPLRGSVYVVNFGLADDSEPDGRRPAVVISATAYNRSATKLLVVAPMTSTIRSLNFGVVVEPPEGGVTRRSQIRLDQLRSVDVSRFEDRLGQLDHATIEELTYLLLKIFDLEE